MNNFKSFSSRDLVRHVMHRVPRRHVRNVYSRARNPSGTETITRGYHPVGMRPAQRRARRRMARQAGRRGGLGPRSRHRRA